jgi:hypothetical protein
MYRNYCALEALCLCLFTPALRCSRSYAVEPCHNRWLYHAACGKTYPRAQARGYGPVMVVSEPTILTTLTTNRLLEPGSDVLHYFRVPRDLEGLVSRFG